MSTAALEFLDDLMSQREARELKGWATAPTLEEVFDSEDHVHHRRDHEMRTDVIDDADVESNAAAAQAAMQKANRALAGRRPLAPRADAGAKPDDDDSTEIASAQAEMMKNNRAAAQRKAAK